MYKKLSTLMAGLEQRGLERNLKKKKKDLPIDMFSNISIIGTLID